MKTKSIRRGFVLLSTMLLVLVLGLVLRAAMIRMPSMLGSSSHSSSQELALRAAESGLEYAIAQLREEPTWTGGGDTIDTVVEQSELGLRVRQNQGNVIGDLTDPSGMRSQFRLRFNYQDGDGGGDERSDPDAEFLADFPFVSVNNLSGEEEAVVPRGEGPGWRVQDPEVGPYETPEKSVCLIVEGRCLRADGTVVARKVVETTYLFVPHRAVNDAAVMAAGGLDVNTSNNGKLFMGGTLVRNASDEKVALRSKAGLVVRKANNSSGDIRVQEDAQGLLRLPAGQNPNANVGPRIETERSEEASDDFYNVAFDQARQTRTNPYRIKSGVYVYAKTPGTPENSQDRQVRYYEMNYEDYKTALAAGELPPPVTVGADLSGVRLDSEPVEQVRVSGRLQPTLQFEPSNMSFTVGGSVQVVPGFNLAVRERDLVVQPSDDGLISGIAIVPAAPAKFDEDDPGVPGAQGDRYNPDFMKLTLSNAKMLVEDGDFHLHGGIVSKGGTLVSNKDITIISGRALSLESEARTRAEVDEDLERQNLEGVLPEGEAAEADQSSSLQLNLYTKGRLRVSTYTGDERGYRNLAFKGLIYTWGDTEIRAGERDQNGDRGTFTLRGAMVAYGGDPELGEPGTRQESGFTGRVDVTAHSANLYWDPRFLPSIGDLSGNASTFVLNRSTTAYPTR